MGKWPNKYTIGLTGNIGTGKSVVRRMLESLGAAGIDADRIGHQVIEPGGPGYIPIVQVFGNGILKHDGQIDRPKLGGLVFNTPDLLKKLEAVVHPLVSQKIDTLIDIAQAPVIVVEAIKLFEAGLADECDSVWVVTSPLEQQLSRLAENRRMSEQQARSRIEAQSSQEQKSSRADVVIQNDTSLMKAWTQVYEAWLQAVPGLIRDACREAPGEQGDDNPRAVRVTPADAGEVANFLNRAKPRGEPVTTAELVEEYSRNNFLVTKTHGRTSGMLHWNIKDRAACGFDLLLDADSKIGDSLSVMTAELDKILQCSQCEVLMIGIPKVYQVPPEVMSSLGYDRCSRQDLSQNTWQAAAGRDVQPGETIFARKLVKGFQDNL